MRQRRTDYSFGSMDRRTGRVEFATEGVVIAVFAMVRFGVGVGCRTDMLKTRFRERRLVRRERVLGCATTAEENNRDEGRENGYRKVTTLGIGQGGSPAELLTVIHKPRKSFLHKTSLWFCWLPLFPI
jgi:hypothetical protein